MPAAPTALQLKTVYLAPSETFVYAHLARLQRWKPHVFAEIIRERERFPLPHINQLPRPALWRRALFAMLRKLLHDGGLRPAFQANAALLQAARSAGLIHAHFGETGVAALGLAQRTGLPLITSFHGRDVAQPLGGGYGRRFYRRLFRNGAAFTVVSELMRAQLITLGAPPERVHLVRTGVDLEAIPFRARTWPDDGAVRLITVGRLVEKKGTHEAISAVARLRQTFPLVSLTVVGDGPLRGALEQHAAALGVASCVEFRGAQPPAEVQRALAKADLFVFPCHTAHNGDQEGAPVVLMEAQAAGLPVISTHHAAVPEIVRDGESGILVAENDVDGLVTALAHMLNLPERWPLMGAAGRAHMAAQFHVLEAVAILERVYDMVATNRE